MGKNHNFVASDILTPELMNGLTQDSQIVSESSKGEDSDAIATTKWVRSASGDTSMNAATATKLRNARAIEISDSDGSHSGEVTAFDGSAGVTLKLPSTIRASLNGNSDTATMLRTARSIKISDSSGSNSGGSESFDGSGDITLKLPSKIKATLDGNATHAGSADTSVTRENSDDSDNIATTAFVKNVAYNPDNPPPNPFEDWRRVTFVWRKDFSYEDKIIAIAETICHKSVINWNYEDKKLSDLGDSAYDDEIITVENFALFIKALGYGGLDKYAMGPCHARLFPMYGLTDFLSNDSEFNPNDLVMGAYVCRNKNTIRYYTSLNNSISPPSSGMTPDYLFSAEIHATVRRIM